MRTIRMPALSLHDLRFTYPARRRHPPREALRGVSLTIDEGQSIALLGPNGSGKSTLLRIVTGLIPPGAGEAMIFDRRPEAARDLLGVVFQTPGLDRHMTVWENLRDSAALYGIDRSSAQESIDVLLRDLRLDDRRDALVKTLSGGLARRVDLCRALLSRPRLLILDEPTAGLDPVARREFLEQLESRRASSALTILMSTHLTDESDRMDRVIMLHEGRVVADDAPAALRASIGARRITVQDANWQPEVNVDRWRRVSEGWIFHLHADEDACAIASHLAHTGAPFTIAPPTLGDVFAHLTGSRLDRDVHSAHAGASREAA
jgi:ABC-2 type transport system ATP-binding protein